MKAILAMFFALVMFTPVAPPQSPTICRELRFPVGLPSQGGVSTVLGTATGTPAVDRLEHRGGRQLCTRELVRDDRLTQTSVASWTPGAVHLGHGPRHSRNDTEMPLPSETVFRHGRRSTI